jgi:hypothetical protein
MGRPRKATPAPESIDEGPVAVAVEDPLDRGGFDFQRGSQRFSDPEEFRRFCEEYPSKQATVTYVYRIWPAINRQQTGHSDSSLEKVTSATENAPPGGIVTADYLSRVWGSGIYHLMFNDLNSRHSQVAKCQVEINDPFLTPNIDPAELVLSGPKGEKNAPVIARYLQLGWSIAESRNDLIPGSFKQLVPPASDKRADPPPAPAPAAPAGAPLSGQVTLDAATFHRLLAAQAAPPAAPAAPAIETVFAIADRIRASSAPAPMAAGGLEELERYIGLLKTMGWAPPGAAAAAPPVESAGSLVSQVLTVLTHAPAILRELRMLGGGPAAVAAADPAPVPAPAPAPARDSAFDEYGEDESDVMIPDLGSLMSIGKQAIDAYAGGQRGDAFAALLLTQNEPVLRWLRSIGQEQALQYLSSAPGMAERIAAAPGQFEAWIAQFFSFRAPQ